MTQEKLAQPTMYCRQCGYALIGLSEDRCPECGQPFDPADPRTFFRHPHSYQRRRWIKRIALALTVVVLLGAIFVAACFGWVYWQYHADWQAEQQAIAALRATARHAVGEYPQPRRSDRRLLDRLLSPRDYLRDRFPRIRVFGPPRLPVDLSHLAAFKQCILVHLNNMRTTDDQLKCLGGLTQLTVLILEEDPTITDEGLVHLKGLTSLYRLSLYGTGVSGPGLRHLQGLTRLRALNLADTQVHGQGLAALKALPSLDDLDLRGTPITDADLVHLKTMPLKAIALDGTKITDAGLAEVGQMTGLQDLYLSAPAITDAGLAYLAGLASLNVLSLHDTAVTDAGIKHLKGLSNLRYLSVNGTKVTPEGIRQLKEALPSLQVEGP